MKQYIIDYEIWDGPNMTGWGNTSLETEGPDDANNLMRNLEKMAREKSGTESIKVRIVGLFKL